MAEPEMMETIGDVLGAAADLIEKRGWSQGKYEDAKHCLCTMGGIHLALTGDPGEMGESAEVRGITCTTHNRLAEFVSRDGVVVWNDDESRTQPEVLHTLRLAAWVYDDQPLPTPVMRHG